jgi:hypothetical protein
MAVIAKALVEGQIIPNTDTTVYTCPLSVTTILDKVTSINYDSVARIQTVSIVAAGAAVGNAYYIAKHTFAAFETYTWPEVVGQVLNANDFVSVISSNNTGVNIRISGREIT